MSKQEIEAVKFGHAELEQMERRYDPDRLADGFNSLPNGEKIYFISNPALGLWAYRGSFGEN